MLIHPTVDRLRALHLRAMADAYLAQQQDPGASATDFDTRLGLLVDAKLLPRDNRKLARHLEAASSASPRHASKISTTRPAGNWIARSFANWRPVGGSRNIAMS